MTYEGSHACADGTDARAFIEMSKVQCRMRMTVGKGDHYSEVTALGDMADPKAPHGVAGAPNEQALLALMERTGYSMIQENGQRKYGGPPPIWEGPAPLRGCEVFVGKIPRDCYEDELAPVFERIGLIYELRLMMDFSGANRGYCFVMYTTRDDAKRAVKELNNFQIRKGRYLGVCLSVDNCRLFVGGIPKNKNKEEIHSEMQKVTEGVVDVIVYPSATDKSKNRGFAFVEYESHRAAAMARRKLIPGRIQLWGHTIAVDWAEPEQEVDEEVMSKVKILYVRNLMLSTTEETLERVFNQAVGKDNGVERVKKIRDYAFVHFRERDDAVRALQIMNNETIETSVVEVSLAKPVDKNDYVRYTRGVSGKPGMPQVGQLGDPEQGLAALPYPYGAGLEANPYLAAAGMAGMPGFYASQLGGAGAISAAAALSAGRGMQSRNQLASRGAVRGRGRGAAGSRGAGGVSRSYVPGYLRGVGTHRKMGIEDRLYDLQPHMELLPTNPITLKPQNVGKSAVQTQGLTDTLTIGTLSDPSPPQTYAWWNANSSLMLEDFCQKSGWGSPIYQLHSAMGGANGDVQLFLFKVSIPALAGQYPNTTFQPNKLCRSVDEAKNYAAEYVLMQLGVPFEGGDAAQQLAAQQMSAAFANSASGTTVSPPPVAVSAATTAALYQGRPLGLASSASFQAAFANCGSTSAAAAAAAAAMALRGDFYTTNVPTTASYVMSPGKLPTPPQSIHPQSYAYTPMAGFQY